MLREVEQRTFEGDNFVLKVLIFLNKITYHFNVTDVRKSAYLSDGSLVPSLYSDKSVLIKESIEY